MQGSHGRSRSAWFSSVIDRIDQALAELGEIRSHTDLYRRRLYDAQCGAGEISLKDVVVDVAAELYSRDVRTGVELLEITDGAFDVLFDLAAERTVLMHGLSRRIPPNSRDVNYHRGFPSVAGYDKGHAMSHAQGGLEGGPNYFAQAPWVNRRLSPVGKLWRDIEDYLARNEGVFSFVRLIYSPDDLSQIPLEAEYGLAAEGQLRVVVFPNRRELESG
ncbi:hypothetical protein AB0O34_18745 [Sphaerisporangium sp. NPDC088356]|uniref:hypothetical protein n=1 Tax=Sphaerisporangium sp. NPDC088356 TaxID=3154871 RepID=UPI00341B1E61